MDKPNNHTSNTYQRILHSQAKYLLKVVEDNKAYCYRGFKLDRIDKEQYLNLIEFLDESGKAIAYNHAEYATVSE